MKKIFTLLSVVGILYSCSKETEIVKYPYQMTFDAIEPVSEMRFFIGATELNPKNNEKTVQGFLDRLYFEETNTGIISHQSKFVEPDPDWFANSYFTFEGKDIIKYSSFSKTINISEIGEVTALKFSATNKVSSDPIVTSDFLNMTLTSIQTIHITSGLSYATKIVLLNYRGSIINWSDMTNTVTLNKYRTVT